MKSVSTAHALVDERAVVRVARFLKPFGDSAPRNEVANHTVLHTCEQWSLSKKKTARRVLAVPREPTYARGLRRGTRGALVDIERAVTHTGPVQRWVNGT